MGEGCVFITEQDWYENHLNSAVPKIVGMAQSGKSLHDCWLASECENGGYMCFSGSLTSLCGIGRLAAYLPWCGR